MKDYLKTHKSFLVQASLIVLWGIGCFVCLDSCYRYHFFYEEQNQLFLLDSEYCLQYLRHPAWLACLVGDFLTQFYYYIFAGPAIVTLLLLTLGDLLRRDLDRQAARLPLGTRGKVVVGWATFVVALVVMSIEARFCLDSQYRLSSVVALVGGAAMWFLFDCLCRRMRWWLRCIMFIPALAVTYWLFGRGWLLLLGIEALSVALLAVLLVGAALGAMIVYVAAPKMNLQGSVALTYPGNAKMVAMDQVRSEERNLEIDNEYYFGHYARVVSLYEKQKEEPSDVMSFYYSLALAQMDVLPEKLMEMKHPFLGTFLTIGEDTPLYTIKMINDLYWAIGDMTYTERAALLANTFSREGRNVRMVRRLAEANIVKGDEAAAEKYLRLLRKTLVYRRWARDHSAATMTAPVKMEMEKKRTFLNTTDHIRLGDDCYTILTQLLDSNPDNTIALTYLLCSDMLSHQKETFVRDYERYGNGGKMIFQQLYSNIQK